MEIFFYELRLSFVRGGFNGECVREKINVVWVMKKVI